MKRYIDEFLTCKCAPDLLALRVFPNAKEITESMGAYHAVRQYVLPAIGKRLESRDVTIIVAGDGHAPRTGALFAFRSAFRVFSVDPVMRLKWISDNRIQRLTALQGKIENCWFDYYYNPILVLVHAHVTLEQALACFRERTKPVSVVAIPCCVPQDYSQPHIEYRDENIWSKMNTVKVWTNISLNNATE